MTTILKPGEAMSHGRIMRIKKEESKTINDQINEFFGRGGKIDKIPDGVSGVDKPKRSFSI
jgi:hypothetical protein